MGSTIWTNDTDTLTTILTDAKQEAIDLIPTLGRGREPGDWLVEAILDKAWERLAPYRTGEPDIENAIRSVGIDDVPVADYNLDYLRDEIDNLTAITLERPVAIIGTAGLWDGTRTLGTIMDFHDVGDIIARAPWADMDVDAWTVDEHDDLRYTGIHHDGVNTCVYRQLKPRKHLPANAGTGLVHALTDPIGPLIRDLYGIPAPKNH